ncbi:MAG: hypothetical protein IT515_14645 [Burkholderiales bacterium]|nr:hypothetical protein [Burkholderiales bacterium]
MGSIEGQRRGIDGEHASRREFAKDIKLSRVEGQLLHRTEHSPTTRFQDPRGYGPAGRVSPFGIEAPGLTASLARADHVLAARR